MPKYKRLLRWFLIVVLCTLMLGILALHVMDHYMAIVDSEIKANFLDKGIDVEVRYQSFEDYRVRIIEEKALAEDSTLIIFVHGAPGDHTAYSSYLEDHDIRDLGQVILYDRPGYGNSSPMSMPSIMRQANILVEIINNYDHSIVLLVGHSYGGPIVGHALARHPDLISKAIMIAPLNNPNNEPIFWFSYFAKWPLTKWLLPKSMQVAGVEKFAHADALREIAPSWQFIVKPILHIHGTADMLAPPEPNIKWSEENIPSDQLQLVLMEDKGHLILWTEFEMIKKEILEFVEQ